MNFIKKTIYWLKGNVPIALALVCMFLALVAVAVITFVMRGQVSESVEKMVAKQTSQAEVLLTQTKVRLPGTEPGSPMTSERVVASPKLIEAMKTINQRFIKTGADMRELSRKTNGSAHESKSLLLNGALTVFTLPKMTDIYKRSFAVALWNPNLPSISPMEITQEDVRTLAIHPLFAGVPLSAKKLQEVADDATKMYLKSKVVEKVSDLSEGSRKEVQSVARNAVLDAMRAWASSISVYAEVDPASPGYPFSGMVRDWGKPGALPPPEVPYESQADLWILRDVAEALSRANHAGEDGYSVLNSPVKRLLGMQVGRDGYVGLHTMGMVVGTSANSAASLSAPHVQLPAEKQSQVNNFFVSPTGRMSNSVYDVKHVKLDVLVDVARLPELLNAIDGVNAMTVVGLTLEDVDEYKEMSEGHYLYGQCDVFKASLVIETLWMRSWTVPLMPDVTRKYLGISATPVN